ncbi:MAG: hypothetical protein ACRDUV_20360 [Pseudonocardiaceae bacterium]
MAGQALGDPVCQQMAEHALASCLSDPAQLARISDPALCHGWAGLIATAPTPVLACGCAVAARLQCAR